MNRLPLADQLPYQFFPPRAIPFWLWVGRFYWCHVLLRKQQRVGELDYQGLENLRPLLDRGDGILITPNHTDHADGAVLLELGHRVGRPFYFMTAYQILLTNGWLGRMLLPKVGAFPVDREGSDLKAFKTGVDTLVEGKHPLVVFPEGEVYHVSDKLTPIREGAASLAVSAAKKLAESKKTAWIVPAAMKYRFVDGYDPLPTLHATMDGLESRFTWWIKARCDLIDRIYAFAEGMLALKELEYFGQVSRGALKPRIEQLRDTILDALEDKLVGKRRIEEVPVRVKELRRICLDRLVQPQITAIEADLLRRDLNDLFVAVQLFSYPGDYLLHEPTVERVAETLQKFEEDLLGYEAARPAGPRRVVVRLGEPIDVGAFLASAGKRGASSALTQEMEVRIQGLLDAIGPGRPWKRELDLPGESSVTPRFAAYFDREEPSAGSS